MGTSGAGVDEAPDAVGVFSGTALGAAAAIVLGVIARGSPPTAASAFAGVPASAGRAVVVALHDLSLAGAWAHRVAPVADGRLRAVGTPAGARDGLRYEPEPTEWKPMRGGW